MYDSFLLKNPNPSITSENVLEDLMKMAARDSTSMSVNIPKNPSCSNQAVFTLGRSTCNVYTCQLQGDEIHKLLLSQRNTQLIQ